MSCISKIYAGWLIDGSGEPFKKNVHIRIKDGLIDKIRRADKNVLNSPGIKDLSGQTVMPSLRDCLVHLSMSGTADLKAGQKRSASDFDEISAVISSNLERHRLSGIGAVRDAGDRNGNALIFKERFCNPEKIPIRLHAAGIGWHARGRYGDFIARSPSKNETLAHAILRRKGNADHVKIINSGLNSLSAFAEETKPQFDFNEMKAAVTAAEQINLKTMVHSNGKIPTQIAVESGCRSIEHGFFMGIENLKKMADRKTIWVPTVYPMKAHYIFLEEKGRNFDVALKNMEHQLDQIRIAKEIGVDVALGTDAGSPGVKHGVSVAKEFEILMTAGFNVEEAVKSSTLNGARLMGIKDMGLVSEGMIAHISAAPGAPSELPESLESLEPVHF